MRTERPTYQPRRILRLAAAVTVAIAATVVATASAGPPIAPPFALHTTCTDTRQFASGPAPRLVSTSHGHGRRTWSYGWPVKPFDRQHPVRGLINDPRDTFHFGIDVSAPDGTAVYSVSAGTINVRSPEVVEVLIGGSSLFAYWHIVPAVRQGQHVGRHQLIGHIAKTWGHVHFAERQGVWYVNPLREGGIGPYVDRTAPTVDEIGFDGAALVTAAHDTPDPRVPGAWADEPVTPGVLRWRTVSASGHPTAWRTAFDFRAAQLTDEWYRQIYTPRTRSNHKGQPGQYCFNLDRTPRLGSGATIEVQVSDSAGNTALYASALREMVGL